jgi:putative spermidine/putrescine transport system permease protein
MADPAIGANGATGGNGGYSFLLRRQMFGLWLVLGFLSFFFVYPIGDVLLLSMTDAGGHFSLASFREVLTSASTQHVLLQTIKTSALVSLVCLAVGYPAACCLARLDGWKATLCNVLILVPFLSSSLVRTFVFIVLLGRRGAVNRLLDYFHIPGAPLQLLFNEAGVVVGMSYVLLPYMLLSMVGSMKRIDPSLLDAALSLGASRLTVFTTIYLPLSLPGVAAGTVITTILGFGYFVTPALMGGPSETMIAQLVEQQVVVTYNLTGAAALAVVMLAVVGIAYAVASRWLGLGRLMSVQ